MPRHGISHLEGCGKLQNDMCVGKLFYGGVVVVDGKEVRSSE